MTGSPLRTVRRTPTMASACRNASPTNHRPSYAAAGVSGLLIQCIVYTRPLLGATASALTDATGSDCIGHS
jgi:hypothetical protein